ncbi:ABC transporter substrate-binding protein [Nocardioides kongjuensis]|uniref:Peptide/nickel transport system substrate-binding protein n=1 Tax=Nocardioides kongjuensis TaxID=349522 RepID=A0A852RRC5_9ACTN|nr:peptide/nickel transport system substrate-binding protein [Nocardioides kongjuensis]
MNRRHLTRITALLVTCTVAAGCGRSADSPETSRTAGDLRSTTTAATKDADPITWAVYRDVQTIDPLYVFDYPDNTALTLFCESLLRTQPDGTITDGLASLSRTDPTTLVLDLDPDATFWDGSKVSAEDVVYSLERQRDPELGGFYAATFSRVDTITATTDEQVTIRLKQADYWLDGELASLPGVVVQKKYVEAKGADYGTPSGGVMCSGAYRFESWSPASGVVAVPNDHYWGQAEPRVARITLKGVVDEAALTSSLIAGEIGGTYPPAISTLPVLEDDKAVTVTQGPGYATAALVISNLKGTLSDVRVRQALSLALDRDGIVENVYHGAATEARWLANPGTFASARDTYQAAYDESPALEQDLTKARKLVDEAGAAGRTITIGMSSAIPDIAYTAGAFKTAGEKIGLKVEFKSVSAEAFINFFIDPKAREGIDAFPTVTYGDYADPAALSATVVLPDGAQNYSGFDDPEITSLMEQARGTEDPDARAKLVIEAQRKTMEQMPWIPTAQPNAVLVTSNQLTGAVSSFAYMSSPWADHLGAR